MERHAEIKSVHGTSIYDMWLSDLSEHLRCAGFAAGGSLRACCGGGGPYNWNGSAICGMAGAVACEDPSASVHWDGGHYTEAMYRYIAKGWLSKALTLIRQF
uniref:Uncharacterized protein n=1 Tax=Oryza glumipatula TaxID=40148 RepID=A0A0E0A1D8_9ORYZ